MKKFILAGMAVAMLAVPTIASASVNDAGVGTVSKGDVQSALKWNNAEFQKDAAGVTFTGTVNKKQTAPVTCSDGTTYDFITTWSYLDKSINAAPVLVNGNKDKINGWNLTGVGSVSGVHTPYTYSQTGQCPAGNTSVSYGTRVITTSVTDAMVNGVALATD